MSTDVTDVDPWETRARPALALALVLGTIATVAGGVAGSLALLGFGVHTLLAVGSGARWGSGPTAVLAAVLAVAALVRLGTLAAPDSAVPGIVVGLAALGLGSRALPLTAVLLAGSALPLLVPGRKTESGRPDDDACTCGH